jgi:hypothetical protein
MICKQCKDVGMLSHIHEGYSMSTALYSRPYYDEKGVYHNHDGNIATTFYTCTKGHQWTAREQNRCPAEDCAWNP